ncbi:hypothetical protein [Clostridium rectalis]|uniref:hypothetical protein n=1 Tax=Clostridium rectalis TaxID=2040295 RepID=UPI000F6428C2|nr:hypothetical protein [Clostridium rectalis]
MKITNKNGYMLVEVILSLTIVFFISTIFMLNINGIKSLLNNIQNDFCSSSILNFINNSKEYCRYNQTNGAVVFVYKENKLMFYSNRKKIYEYKLPQKFNIYYVNARNNEIRIDKTGFSSDACTICYKDGKGKEHKITMCVGTSHVQIQER